MANFAIIRTPPQHSPRTGGSNIQSAIIYTKMNIFSQSYRKNGLNLASFCYLCPD